MHPLSIRLLAAVLLAAVPAAPAAAKAPTTLDYVTTKGVVMKVSGLDIPVAYAPDGTFSAMNGAVTGAWRLEGEAMCSTSSAEPAEVCIAYPPGKKPGDQFDIAGPRGPLTIRIND